MGLVMAPAWGIPMRIGFLGLGKMGTPMALRLIAAGHELSVWNRNEGRTKPLIHEGAIAAATPAEAELGADAVITMLSDDEAYEEVLFGPNGLVEAFSPGGLHISCSTISVALSAQLTLEYGKRGVDFIGAPVFGRPELAEKGQLWVVAAGADSALRRAHPVLDAFSRGITTVGKEPRQAHAAKLGGNFLVSAMIHSLAESFAFAECQGVEPEIFFEAINNGLFQSPYFAEYAELMLHPPKDFASFSEPGPRDLRLLREATASRQIRLGFADRMAEIFAERRRASPRDLDPAGDQPATAHRSVLDFLNVLPR